MKRCVVQLREDYGIDIEERGFVRGVYNLDLERFAKGIFSGLRQSDPTEYARKELSLLEQQIGDTAGHLRRSFEHITRGQQRQIVLFLDNVDQRPSDFQEQVFLIAESLAERGR